MLTNKVYSTSCPCGLATAIKGKNGTWLWYYIEGTHAEIRDHYCDACYKYLDVDDGGPYYATDVADKIVTRELAITMNTNSNEVVNELVKELEAQGIIVTDYGAEYEY